VVQGLLTISLITGQVKVQYFLSGIYNNILFTKDGFVDTKSTKKRFRFRTWLCPGPCWGSYNASLDLAAGVGGAPSPFPSPSTHLASRCTVTLLSTTDNFISITEYSPSARQH